MTLWQLEHLYRKPFLKRLKAMQRQLKSAHGSVQPKPQPATLDDKERFAQDAAVRFGNTVEHWRAEWERGRQRRAEWDAEMNAARGKNGD